MTIYVPWYFVIYTAIMLPAIIAIKRLDQWQSRRRWKRLADAIHRASREGTTE